MENSQINNAFYDELQEGWYNDKSHPIALLRAENAIRNPWILETIGPEPRQVLDIGCGAGLLTNSLALAGHHVTGVDLSVSSLEVARQRDTTQSVRYLQANAMELGDSPESFDVVCAMDFLEHVEQPQAIVALASRLLRPNGLFFFHTFNRNWLSYLLIIKGVDWFVPNSPPHMHVYSLFIKPQELSNWCADQNLAIQSLRGLSPRPTLRGLLSRQIQRDLQFRWTRSLLTGYLGYAVKSTSR